MEKTGTLNLRVNPVVKQQAEDVLRQLGIPMATAVDIYLRQISLTGSIPFPITLPKAPPTINTDGMAVDEIRAMLQDGYEDMKNGHVQDAATAFDKFKAAHE